MHCGSRPKEFIKFLAGLQKQRMIKRWVVMCSVGVGSATHPHRSVLLILVSDSFTNTENYTIPRTDYQRKNTVKREYWYIDYHDVTNVVKYRLAAIRQRIESSTKKVREREINPLRLVTQITKLLFFSLSA